MKKNIYTIVTILLFYSTIKAQNKNTFSFSDINKFPKENIYVHHNSSFMLTGETLYYKIYCLNETEKKISTLSKVAYLELIDSNNNSILKHKINLKKGSGYGDFFLNTAVKTGAYKLISYTQWMRNKQKFYESDIFIVNPFLKKSNSLNNVSISSSAQNSSSLIKNNIKTYLKREKILLNIDKLIPQKTANLSISIRKKESFKIPDKINSKKILTNFKKEKNSDHFYLPELRGSLIKGQLFSKKNEKKISTIKLGLSVKGNNNITKTAITNELGEFYFNINNLKSSTIIVQILDLNFDNYIIKLNNNSLEKKFKNFKKIYLNNAISKEIKDRTLYLQIENAYYSVKKDSVYDLNKKDPLFDFQKKVYKLDEFKRFKTVRKTFIEVIEGAWINKNKENYKIYAVGPAQGEILTSSPSLLIVDGHIIYNHNDFIDFNPKKIKTIAVVKNKYQYGNGTYQGVVIVNTFKSDYVPNTKRTKEFNVLKAQPEKKYFFQKHNKKTKRIPDYRTQLYWNPNIDLSEKEITFYTSDVSGEFEIKIEGFTKKGEPISLRKTFFVD